MSTQPFKQAGGGSNHDEGDAGQIQQSAPQVNTSDIDSMLDEIDGVLESNAAEFVSGFIQKGGE